MDADGTVILNGPQGITGTPKDSTLLIGVILILMTLFIVLNLINSRDGRAIMAIRDNRIAAESIGINITKYKLMAFTISAAMAGAAGVLYAHNLSTLTANTEQLWLQYVHHDPCICSTWWNRKYPWFYYCSSYPDTPSGASPWTVRLPYADLCDRADRHDAL